MQFKYQLHHQRIQESESAAPCVLQKPITKQKPFAKHAIAIFAVIILSLFAESVTTNNHKLFRICLHCIIVKHTFVYHVFSAGINTYMNYVQRTYQPKCKIFRNRDYKNKAFAFYYNTH